MTALLPQGGIAPQRGLSNRTVCRWNSVVRAHFVAQSAKIPCGGPFALTLRKSVIYSESCSYMVYHDFDAGAGGYSNLMDSSVVIGNLKVLD